MSSAEPGLYRLAPKCLEDLEDVWRYTAETWSVAQADDYIDDLIRVFEAIATTPTLGRERPEFTPLVRIHPHQSHVIVYIIRDEGVVVLRILGGRQNWRAILQAMEG